MTDIFRTKNGLKQLDQNFRNIGSTSIQNFLNSNLVKVGNIAQDNYIPIESNNTKNSNLSYLTDRGNGRISKGVKSLEAITKIFKGISSSALVLFEQVIYDNPSNFKEYDSMSARQIIYNNLGLAEYISLAKSVSQTVIDDLNNMVDRMFKDMKNLTFTYDNYINEALIKCKNVVAASINYKDT